MAGRGFAAGYGTINRAGRPKGIPARLHHALKQVDDSLDKLIATMIKQALAGDMNAASFLVGRRLPAQRPHDHHVEFPLPDDIAPGDLPALAHSIITAVSLGQVSPDQGAKLGQLLIAAAGVHGQDDDLRSRLAVIEKRIEMRLGPGISKARSTIPTTTTGQCHEQVGRLV